MNFKILLIIAVSLLALMVPETAHAIFDVSDTDKSKQIFIDPLFGPITGGGTSPLSEVIKAFNLAMLFIGGILVAYTLVAGTMSTAHDGEMMGKKWSSMWVPIRTAVGTAAILPVNAGFCFAQMVVIWLALQGVGLANSLVKEFIPNALNVTLFDPPSVQRPIRQVLESMLVSSACHATMQHQFDSGNTRGAARLVPSMLNVGTPSVTAVTPGTDILRSSIGVKAVIRYGGFSGSCGVISLASGQGAAFGDSSSSIGGVTGNALFDVDSYREDLVLVHEEQMRSAVTKLYTLSNEIIDSSANAENYEALGNRVTKELDDIALQWNTALVEKARETMAQNTNDKFMNSIIEDGWLLLGAWYIEIAKAQDAIVAGISSIPASSFGTFVGKPEENDSWFTRATKGTWRWVNQKATGMDSAMISENMAIAEALASAGSSGGVGGAVADHESANTRSWTSKVVSWFINADVSLVGEQMSPGPENPILMARNLGQNMTMMGWAGYALSIVPVSIWPGVAAMLSPMITAISGLIIVSGATLSTYLPMLPFVLWIGVALSWAIFLLEAMFAAPLWAVTHLAPDGDGVVGRGGQGYMLVLSLVLRPGLAVLGFVSATVLMNPIGELINATFIGAFLSGVNPSIFGLSQMIMGCVLYCVLMISVITKVFSLIHVVPDKILRWIGGAGADIGDTAAGIQGETGQKVIVGAQVGQSLGAGMTTGLQNARANALQNRTAASNELSGAERNSFEASNSDINSGDSLKDSMEAAEENNTPEARGGIAESRDGASTTALHSAKSRAKTAVSRAQQPKATKEHKKAGAAASSFLNDLNKSGTDINNPEQARKFMQENAGKNAGTSWGQTMANANKRDAAASQKGQDLEVRGQESEMWEMMDRDKTKSGGGDDGLDGDSEGFGGSGTERKW